MPNDTQKHKLPVEKTYLIDMLLIPAEIEEWKDIIGYVGYYQVSSFGRVKSLRNIRGNTDKILSQIPNWGYLRVGLWVNGVSKIKRVHRIVAESFIENPKNKPCVNHKDGNKTNNNVSNLEWVTYSENELHSCRVLIKSPNKPWLGKKGSLNKSSIPVIITNIVSGENEYYPSFKEALQRLSCSAKTLIRCLKGIKSDINGFKISLK